jgi:hypothetical protein
LAFVKNKKPEKGKQKYELNERLNVLSKEYQDLNYTYLLTEKDRQELLFEKLKEKYPDTYFYDIHRLLRIQVRGKPEEYLVYIINEEITDTRFQKYTLNRKVGVHSTPVGTPKQDEYGAIEDININQWKVTFEIPFNQDEIKKLLESSRTPCLEYAVAKGAIIGKGSTYVESPRTVYNFEEWLTLKFDDLYNASNLGYLKDEFGGVEEYLAVRNSRLEHKTTASTDSRQVPLTAKNAAELKKAGGMP